MGLNFIGKESLQIKEPIRMDLVNSALEVLNNTYGFNVTSSNFNQVRLKIDKQLMLVELRNAIRFVPQQSVYYYNAVVYLNTSNVGLGFECNPAKFDQNKQPQFFQANETQRQEINDIIQYLTKHHQFNHDTFLDQGGELTIYAQPLKYKIKMISEQNCDEIVLFKNQLD